MSLGRNKIQGTKTLKSFHRVQNKRHHGIFVLKNLPILSRSVVFLTLESYGKKAFLYLWFKAENSNKTTKMRDMKKF